MNTPGFIANGRFGSGPTCRSKARPWLRTASACRALAGLMLVGFVLGVARPRPALADPTEQEVKAALIFNLTRFIDWPAASFASPNATFVVAIMGQDRVSDALVKTLANKSVNGRRFEVRHLLTTDDASKCQLLYIAESERRHVDAILFGVRGEATLAVAAIDRFAERGGGVALVLEDQQVHLVVNLASTQASHLTVSSRLLAVAKIVGGTP